MSETKKQPFRPLGNKLKTLREKLHESLAEVSGALELDMEILTRIEEGEQLPSEETLLLLISHFELKDTEANHLFELAGYEKGTPKAAHDFDADTLDSKPYVMVMPMDARIVYTDMVHVMANNYGVVINFMQGSGPNNQPLAISRIGMSREHAESLLEVLKQTLEQSQKKQLQPPDDSTTDQKN